MTNMSTKIRDYRLIDDGSLHLLFDGGDNVLLARDEVNMIRKILAESDEQRLAHARQALREGKRIMIVD